MNIVTGLWGKYLLTMGLTVGLLSSIDVGAQTKEELLAAFLQSKKKPSIPSKVVTSPPTPQTPPPQSSPPAMSCHKDANSKSLVLQPAPGESAESFCKTLDNFWNCYNEDEVMQKMGVNKLSSDRSPENLRRYRIVRDVLQAGRTINMGDLRNMDFILKQNDPWAALLKASRKFQNTKINCHEQDGWLKAADINAKIIDQVGNFQYQFVNDHYQVVLVDIDNFLITTQHHRASEFGLDLNQLAELRERVRAKNLDSKLFDASMIEVIDNIKGPQVYRFMQPAADLSVVNLKTRAEDFLSFITTYIFEGTDYHIEGQTITLFNFIDSVNNWVVMYFATDGGSSAASR